MRKKRYYLPTKSPIKRLRRRFSLKKLSFKNWKRYLFYSFLTFIFLVAATFAWFAKDLPTPGKIKNRRPEESTQINDREGNLLYSVHGEKKREVIDSKLIPQNMKNAVIAVEDSNFYHHHGVNFKSIIRAVIANFTHKTIVQGGSTITQQFVKNALLSPKKTITRKIKEVILSWELEIMYSKDEILGMYLNEIPFGSNNYGVQAASKTYFGKDVKDLTLAESATLASIPQAPTYYSPYGSHLDNLMKRKNYVLDRMKDLGYTNEKQANQAKEQKIAFTQPRENIKSPHFVMYVKELLADKYGDRIVEEGGLRVTTTLDPKKQELAEKIIAESMPTLTRQRASNAGLVAMDPKTGDILAMVGSRDYFDIAHEGNVNVTISNRQPGSSFKPIVYATALKGQWSPASNLWDLKTDFGGGYNPDNYNGRTNGPVSVRQALSGSLNIPAVKMLYLAGIDNSIKTSREMGITTFSDPKRYGLALVLGGGEVKLLELTGAYSVFAAGGLKHDFTPILKIEDQDGKILEEKKSQNDQQVLDPQIAYQISNILSDNQSRSFIFGSRSALVIPDRHVAAKTGTTDDFRDAWTIGFTTSLVTGVWVGNFDNSPMLKNAAGAMAAAPIWNAYMTQALAGVPDEDFPRPEGLQEVTIDALTGKLPASSGILGTRRDIFTSWQVPKEKSDTYTKVKVNKMDNLLATDSCPPQVVVEKTFTNIHSEVPDNPNWERPVQAWASGHGIGSIAPRQVSPLCDPNNKPSIKIASPANGATVSGNTTLTSSVNSPNGGARVEYFADGVSIGISTANSFSLTYNMNNLSSGEHTILARVIDKGGWSAEDSIMITVVPDNSPPGEATWLDSQISVGPGKVTLVWQNPSDSDLSRIKIYKSTSAGNLGSQYGGSIKAKSGSTQSLTITGLTSGVTYYFTVRTLDTAGNENQNVNQKALTPL